MKVLVTCPPMLGMFDAFRSKFSDLGIEAVPAKVLQTMSEDELCEILPEYDGWIIGDDPASRRVLQAGNRGKLRAVVKWGIGVDNVDFQACKDLGIPVSNTPFMFGGEVADLAHSYLLALARETFWIDREIRSGHWPKPCGMSLAGKTAGVIGLGDIGRNLVRRLQACDMNVVGWDPGVDKMNAPRDVELQVWPNGCEGADFLVFTCSLNAKNFHMLSSEVIEKLKSGVRIINVARGGLIHEDALINGLRTEKIHSAALDVFEVEPLPLDSYLRKHPRCIFGSHNASNTRDGVIRASERAIDLISDYLRGAT